MYLESNLFRLSPLRCAGFMVARYAWRWIVIFAIILTGSLVLGFALDIRILFIALMVMSLTAPVILAILYYRYGLYGECYLNIINHKIVSEQEFFTVKVLIRKISDEDEREGEAGDAKDDEVRSEHDEEVRSEHDEEDEFKDFKFAKTSLGAYSVGKDYVAFPFVLPLKGFLFIPVTAFETEDEFRRFVRFLSGRTKDASLGRNSKSK